MKTFEIAYDLFIIASGIVVFAMLYSIHAKLLKIKKDSVKIYKETKSSSAINASTNHLANTTYKEIDTEVMDELRESFNESCSDYYSKLQLISIFPMLGLLGTVCSLMPGLHSVGQGDATALYSALGTALTSTICGLVVSVILKFLASGHTKTISDIENTFDENDRKYRMALDFERVTGAASSNK